VLAYDDTVVWSAEAPGAAGLAVQDDGNVVVTGADGAVLWASATAGNPGRRSCSRRARCCSARRRARSSGVVDVPADVMVSHQVATDCDDVTAPVPQEDTVVTWQGVRVHPCLADALDALMTAARADGIDLRAWGWRSSSQQIALRAANCSPTEADPTVVACRPQTAPPATSRHERGSRSTSPWRERSCGPGRPRSCGSPRTPAFYGLENLPGEPWHWSVDGW
jgi:hypothetical protein